MRSVTEPLLMGLSVLIFFLSTAAMALGQEPFASWYYCFAWWSYILFVDAWLQSRGARPVVARSPEALRLMALSVAIWASFELYNFRLGNWYYIELPPLRAVRWAGYTVAYSTVLPGVFVTWKLLQRLFPPRKTAPRPLPRRLPAALFWAGMAGSLLPLLWPRWLFPLVWLGPTALFAALNYRWGGEGILRRIEGRGPAGLYRLIAAGGLCGLLWELWNYWARSKWGYEIPFFDRFHLFEMPLAGFAGFLPFAVECHEMYWAGRKGLDGLKTRPWARRAGWVLLAVYVAGVYAGIDRFTVRSLQHGSTTPSSRTAPWPLENARHGSGRTTSWEARACPP